MGCVESTIEVVMGTLKMKLQDFAGSLLYSHNFELCVESTIGVVMGHEITGFCCSSLYSHTFRVVCGVHC